MHFHKDKAPRGPLDTIAAGKFLIVLGMGCYLLWLILTGNLNNYINQRFAWLVYVGAGVFFLLAAVQFGQAWRSGAAQCHHEHYAIGGDILLIVAFPLLLALLIPARPLGIEAVNGGVSMNSVGVASEAFSRSPLDRNILDWLREFERAPTPAAFNDSPADVVGFVYREPHFEAAQFMVARFTMSCCVADAFPIGMPAQWAAATEYEAGAWLRLRGSLQAGDFAGEFLPILHVETIERVDEPAQPYLYP